MAKSRRPLRVKLVLGAIFASEGILIKAKAGLKEKFGPLDFKSPIMSFDYTKYYEQEMGPKLLRQFFSFQRLIDPEQLAAIKLYTNRLEKELSRVKNRPSRTINPSTLLRIDSERNRNINLDPGYITAAKLVLATCKDYSHRIYLNRGIYAEVTLDFHDGTFMPSPWAYPDYKTSEYIRSFNAIREIYLKQLPGRTSLRAPLSIR